MWLCFDVRIRGVYLVFVLMFMFVFLFKRSLIILIFLKVVVMLSGYFLDSFFFVFVLVLFCKRSLIIVVFLFLIVVCKFGVRFEFLSMFLEDFKRSLMMFLCFC